MRFLIFLMLIPSVYAFGFGVSPSCDRIAVFNPNNFSINVTAGSNLMLKPHSFGFVNYSEKVVASNGDFRIMQEIPECNAKHSNYRIIIIALVITAGFFIFKFISGVY